MTTFFDLYPFKIITPLEWGALIDYTQDVWDHPLQGPIPRPSAPRFPWTLIAHHGGGPNPAGDPANDPGVWLTWRQKLAVWFGLGASVLRAWERFHIFSRLWRGIAYNLALHPRSGHLYGLRMWAANGAQLGEEWNSHSLAIVSILGSGQHLSRRAKRILAGIRLIWPSRLMGHQETKPGSTSCPGTIQGLIDSHFWVDEVCRPKYRVGARNPMYAFVKVRLGSLGRLDVGRSPKGMVSKVWTREARHALERFQGEHALEVTGRMDSLTVAALDAEGMPR